MNSLDIIEDPASNRWKQRIVQKFLERPFLLNLNAESYGFVIKSWVLITETEPLTIYVFDSFIIRVESAEWNIDRPGNISSRLSSRYKHRVGSSTFFERYMAQSYPNFVAQEELLPKMHKIIITTCESCADSFKPQEGQFQLVTFSWSLDADRNPWLQKVGASSFPTCSKPDIREMLDSMAEGLLRIVLDKEEQQGPLYDLSYELQGELSFDTHIWQLLFQADIAPPPEEDFKPSANLILHGRKVNYHVEKQYDVHHFRPEAVPYIQRVTRGWFVRFEAYKKLRLSSCLIIQRNIRMFLAVCKLRHMQRKKALFHFPRILRTFLATQKVQAIKDNRLAKVTQRWYRGKRDRRTVHTMWLQNSSRVVARYFRKFWDRRNVVNKQKRNWAIVHLQMYWRRRFRMLNRQARNIQRLTRGHFGRNIYRVEKDYDDKLRLVQRWIRGYLDRRRCYHLRRLYASTFIQSVVRMLPDRKKFYRYRMAARLQSWVRMWRLRREYKRYISARKIQSVFRMYPVRVRYVRFTSARKMQALVRMFIPRMQYIKYMSARKLQTRIRGWVARRRLAKYTIVTKINALARGFIARRRHWKYFYARKIQARIREVLCRRPYQRYIAARKIQARIRTFLAENRYLTKVMQHREHIAAIKIQKIVRGYCTAKRVDIHKLIADERRRVQVAFLWEDVKDEIVRLHEEELMIIEEQLSGLVRQNSWNRLRQIAEEERLEEQRLEEIARAKDEQLMIVEDQLSEIRRSYEEIERQKTCQAGQQMARKQQQLEEERLARAQRRKEKDILKAKEIAVQAAAEEERRKRTEELRETGPAIRQFMLVEAPDITMGVIISQAGGRMENSHAGFIKEIGKQRPESPEPERLVSAHSRLPNIFQGREEPSSIEKQNIKVEDFRKVHPPAKRFD